MKRMIIFFVTPLENGDHDGRGSRVSARDDENIFFKKYFRALYWEGEGGLAPTLAFSNRCGSPPWAEDLIRIDQALDERDRQRLENTGEKFS
jgi:hypothetical protein